MVRQGARVGAGVPGGLRGNAGAGEGGCAHASGLGTFPVGLHQGVLSLPAPGQEGTRPLPSGIDALSTHQ